MDHIQDLTARAVSFITFIQDTFLKGSVHRDHKLSSTHVLDVFGPGFPATFSRCMGEIKVFEQQRMTVPLKNESDSANRRHRLTNIERKTIELVWLSGQPVGSTEKEVLNKAENYLLAVCNDLSVWIARNAWTFTSAPAEFFDAFSAPQTWRDVISRRLYQSEKERIELAGALEYLPLNLVLALGGCDYSAAEQRILQWWQTGKKEPDIPLTGAEQTIRDRFLQVVYDSFQDEREKEQISGNPAGEDLPLFYQSKIKQLLSNYAYVADRLVQREAPLSFPYVFAGELEEIQKSRVLRFKELNVKERLNETLTVPHDSVSQMRNGEAPEDSREREKSCNPVVTAQEMNLMALTFSGGGIRSATFNLGILQGLSKKGVLSHVDYLSTVSGGGYIGSWLATWIKRSGSLSKVQDRLNPDVSTDPLGEEVRPIRWLRMFSNYLAPDKSIMSTDSWTMGITWLRNTLLNQVVILLALLALMLIFRVAFQVWTAAKIWAQPSTGQLVYISALVLLVVLAYLTGLGMQWYHRAPLTGQYSRVQQKQNLASLVVGIAITGAFIISAAMYVPLVPLKGKVAEVFSLKEKLPLLLPAAGVTFLILLGIALFGRYDKCIRTFNRQRSVVQSRLRLYGILITTALFAATAGWLALAGTWKLFSLVAVKNAAFIHGIDVRNELAFTLGVPLLLMVFGVTVVSRMAFLGKYFPDERREWWGRMGAVINRVAVLWLLVSASATLLDNVLHNSLSGWQAPASVGGWMALIGGAVKAAFSGKTAGNTAVKGFQASALDWLSKAAPYLFALGLLIFLPHLADWLLKKPLHIDFIKIDPWWKQLLKTLCYFGVFAAAALYLSSRLGVNEFSMHHFYRNRLVRAYLGASRSRRTRDKTVNPFTGFDRLDDEKLSVFRNSQGYYGPYPVLNTALNASQVTDLSRQDRKAESFVFTPLYSGFDFSKVRSAANMVRKSYDFGYRPTPEYAYENGPGIGTAMAISGAAANPNMGYHSSAGTAFLLTVFNAQLGWWIGNPRKSKWKKSDPRLGLAYVFYNMTGRTNTSNEFVCLSDGGHFDNMGLYEMIRRRCALVMVCDGEQDEAFTCEGLANAIRRCRIDFGAEISIDTTPITRRDGRFSEKQYAIGKICYSGDKEPSGTLIYVKASVTGKEPVDVKEYTQKNEAFPHQSTGDQFFDEQQFESYRKLGMYIADTMLKDKEVVDALNRHLDLNQAPAYRVMAGDGAADPVA